MLFVASQQRHKQTYGKNWNQLSHHLHSTNPTHDQASSVPNHKPTTNE